MILYPREGDRTFRVTDENGAPLADAWVWNRGDGKVLRVGADGRVTVPDDWVGYEFRAPGRAVVGVPPGGEVALPPAASIAGVVVDTAGRPVPGARVGPAGDALRSVTTDGRGRFVLEELAPGDLVVVRAGKAHHYAASATVATGANDVRLVLANSSTLRIRLEPPGGDISDPWIRTFVLPVEGQAPEEGWPRDGHFPLAGRSVVLPVPAGRIAVWVASDSAGPRTFVLDVDPDRGATITYDFPPPGELALDVRDEAGAAVAGAEVRELATRTVVGWTDDTGGLPAPARKKVPRGHLAFAVFAPGFVPAATEVVDTARGARASVVLSRGVELRGKVVDGRGEPVEAGLALPDDPIVLPFGTNAAGLFFGPHPVRPGRVRLRVRPEEGLPFETEVTVPADGGAVTIRVP